jgi:hypothetical protein
MDQDERIATLERRIDGLEGHFRLWAGLMTGLRPVRPLLARYGLTEDEQIDLFRLIEEMSERHDGGELPSFSEFVERVTGIAPVVHGDRAFVALLVEALRIERPDSAPLYQHFSRAMELVRV